MTAGPRVPEDFFSLAYAFARAQGEVDSYGVELSGLLRHRSRGLAGGGAATVFNGAAEALAEAVVLAVGDLVRRLGEAATAAAVSGQNLLTADFDSNIGRIGEDPVGTGAPRVLTEPTSCAYLEPVRPAGASPDATPLEPLHLLLGAFDALGTGLPATAARLNSDVTALCTENVGAGVDAVRQYWGTLWPGTGSAFGAVEASATALVELLRTGITLIGEFRPKLLDTPPGHPHRTYLLSQLDEALEDAARRSDAADGVRDLRRALAAVPRLQSRRARTHRLPRLLTGPDRSPRSAPPRRADPARWPTERVRPEPLAPPATATGRGEVAVAALTCGTVMSAAGGGPDLRIAAAGLGSTQVHVIGGDGSYITVFDRGRNAGTAITDGLRHRLSVLLAVARQHERTARAYFERSERRDVLADPVGTAAEVLGRENVFLFTNPERGMSDGFFRWHRGGLDRRGAEELLRLLSGTGLRLDPASRDEAAARRELAGTLADRSALPEGETWFQLWLDAETDVGVTCRRLEPDGVSLDFALDGLGDQDGRVVDSLVRAMHLSRDSRGFVIDRTGRSEGVDWDAVLRGSAARIAVAPNHLGLPARYAPLHPELADKGSTDYQDLKVFVWER